MTELTPQLVKGLMNNVPPQQDFRQAVTIESSDPGSVVYRIDVPQDQCNYHGTIFGGFINCMLEAAAGMATYAYGMNNVAISCATNFIRAVKPQVLTVSAHTTHKGRTTTVCHVDIKTPEGKLVAESTFTMFLLGRYSPPKRPFHQLPELSRGNPSQTAGYESQPPQTQREGGPEGPPLFAMLPCCQGVCYADASRSGTRRPSSGRG